MIQESYIREWHTHAPWRDWPKVEQDLILCRGVTAIFQNTFLADHLIFRGGTALHKLYFTRPYRYSEDIDLVQIKAGPIGPIFDALRGVLTPVLGKPKHSHGSGVATLTYRTISEIPPALPLRLKVEINSREHFSVLEVQKKEFTVESPWFTGKCEIPVFALEELLASKLRALYQRRKGRDLFDLWAGLTHAKSRPQQIVAVFRRYMEFSGKSVSRDEFAANLEKKKMHPAFRADLSPLLPIGQDYDFTAGFDTLEREILSRL